MSEYKLAAVKNGIHVAEGRGGQREWLLSGSGDGDETILEPEPFFDAPFEAMAKSALRRKVQNHSDRTA